MTKELNAIIEAYEGILSEGKEAKFKVGDKVGIGSHNSYNGSYFPIDTGIVKKVSSGVHTVEFDNRVSHDDPSKKFSSTFDHVGKAKLISNAKLTDFDNHNKMVKDLNDNHERNEDLRAISSHIEGLRNGFGNHSKITKAHSEFLKSLIDKHTEEK